MKHRRLIAILGVLFVLLVGVSAGAKTLTVGASTLPHAPILQFVKPLLAAEGIDLNIVEFSDYVLPNLALAAGDLDANFFQHIPYQDDFAANHGLDLVAVQKVFVAPIGLYSKKIDSIDELKRNARIALPNDVTNAGRAFVLLEEAGLIQLRAGVGANATSFDVVTNPLNLRFIELEAPLLPRALDEVDAAFINQTYALEANLSPVQDAILLEGAQSPYANVLTARADNHDDPAVLRLAEMLTTPAVREFILDYFEGSIVPAF